MLVPVKAKCHRKMSHLTTDEICAEARVKRCALAARVLTDPMKGSATPNWAVYKDVTIYL